ncbi:MAG: DUF5679 domain-containing protein [Limisphaerales bacterium]
MSKGESTPTAAVLWGVIPREARERILANVFCVKCRRSSTMVNFTGEEQNGDVILRGACANCGHDAVRLLEASETNRSLN